MTPDEQRLYVEAVCRRIVSGDLTYPQASNMVLAHMGVEDLERVLGVLRKAKKSAKAKS